VVNAPLGKLTRLFVGTVQHFYAERAAAHSGVSCHDGTTGPVTVIERTSSDLRLNPHLHGCFSTALTASRMHSSHGSRLVIGKRVRSATCCSGIDKHLRRHGLFDSLDPDAELQDAEDQLAALAVSDKHRRLDRNGRGLAAQSRNSRACDLSCTVRVSKIMRLHPSGRSNHSRGP
jgi:hypothetical protein